MREIPDPRPGEEIDGFHIGEKLHEGGMARVFRVTRPGLESAAVMKVPKLDFGSHPGFYTGFEVEQMVLPMLSGEHVPRVFGRGDQAVRPYLVQEYIEGPSLGEQAARAPLAPSEVAQIGARVADALHDLHRQDVVHMDVKPQNILFRRSGQAVLIDFGLAWHNRLPDLVDEQFQTPAGSGAYIAPEQLLGIRGEPRSDIFSLGVVLYQLATGRLPFGSPASLRACRKRLYSDPLPPRALNPGVPPWLQEIILHCLETEPVRRYATAAQVAHDLAHPGTVPLTGRSSRLKRSGIGQRARRWYRSWRGEPLPPGHPSARLASANHVLVALDPTHVSEGLAYAMQDAVRRLAATDADCRILCVTVLEPSGVGGEEGGEALNRSEFTRRQLELRHWAGSLGLPPEAVRFHVIEATDPAGALVDFATRHHADQIVMGARASSAMRRFLGSVSARVVAEAPCTVTVVRAR